MSNVVKNSLCALVFAALPIAAPAGATVIASFSFANYGVGFGGFGDVMVFSPEFSVLVNGTSEFSAVPVDGTNVFILDGSALATMAAELSDGAPDTYDFKFVLDSVNDQFGLILIITEATFTGAASLPGASIQGIRITLNDLCMQPTTAGGCTFPGPGFVGFDSQLLVEVSDAPFPRVPEPGTLLLLVVGCYALATVRRTEKSRA